MLRTNSRGAIGQRRTARSVSLTRSVKGPGKQVRWDQPCRWKRCAALFFSVQRSAGCGAAATHRGRRGLPPAAEGRVRRPRRPPRPCPVQRMPHSTSATIGAVTRLAQSPPAPVCRPGGPRLSPQPGSARRGLGLRLGRGKCGLRCVPGWLSPFCREEQAPARRRSGGQSQSECGPVAAAMTEPAAIIADAVDASVAAERREAALLI